MRPIDADKLKAHYAWWGSEGASEEMQENKKTFDTIIGLQPTVEAEPIKHGVWIKRYTDGFCNGVRNYEMICPFCDYSYLDNHIGLIVPEYFNYCPNCGAKLDGKEN